VVSCLDLALVCTGVVRKDGREGKGGGEMDEEGGGGGGNATKYINVYAHIIQM